MQRSSQGARGLSV